MRLQYCCVTPISELAQKIDCLLKKTNIEECVTKQYVLMARSLFSDALKMFRAKEYFAAQDCCRNSLWKIIGAINSFSGYPNLKEKWISKIFIDHTGFGFEDILKKYYKFQIYPQVSKENFTEYIKEFIEFLQECINTVEMRKENNDL